MNYINEIIFCIVAISSIISFVLFAVDKQKAIKRHWRIPESTLLWSAFLGGAAGGLLAMIITRHKTRKPKFYISVPIFLILQIIIIIGVQYVKL